MEYTVQDTMEKRYLVHVLHYHHRRRRRCRHRHRNHHRHHHWAAAVSRGLVKTSACRLQVSLHCATLCQIISLQYFSTPFLHRLTGLP